jgi:hypothetical protein
MTVYLMLTPTSRGLALDSATIGRRYQKNKGLEALNVLLLPPVRIYQCHYRGKKHFGS